MSATVWPMSPMLAAEASSEMTMSTEAIWRLALSSIAAIELSIIAPASRNAAWTSST
jgi:hypothetical protein